MSFDLKYMELALKLAVKGHGFTSPNPVVGAVCVRDGDIVGKGYHQKYGGAHAEVNALDQAGGKAKGSTLYVTLEPCNHHGKTPPCTKKILDCGVKKVVVAMEDPNPVVDGTGNDFLRSKGVEVVTGVMEDEAKAINLPFIKYITKKIPYTILKLAMTLDGKIATKTGDSKWITNPNSRAWVHKLRHQADAILVGRGTVEGDDPSLSARLGDDSGISPIRVILDSSLSLNPKLDLKIFNDDLKEQTIIACCADADPAIAKNIEDIGLEVIKVPRGIDNRVDFSKLLEELGKRKISSLMIEGGAEVAGSALNNSLIDQAALFYAPKILACKDSFDGIKGSGPQMMADAINVLNPKTSLFAGDILVEGRIDSGWKYNQGLIWPVGC